MCCFRQALTKTLPRPYRNPARHPLVYMPVNGAGGVVPMLARMARIRLFGVGAWVGSRRPDLSKSGASGAQEKLEFSLVVVGGGASGGSHENPRFCRSIFIGLRHC